MGPEAGSPAYLFDTLGPQAVRDQFDCGVEALNVYLKQFARQNDEKRINKTFIAYPALEPSHIAGYYTLSPGQIEFESLPDALKKKLPHYPIPVARIGRLAVDLQHQGKGLGQLLLVDAIKKVKLAESFFHFFALQVDAKNVTARRFYSGFGFVELKNDPLKLLLPYKTFKNLS